MTRAFSKMMGCCRSRPERQDDGTNAHVRLIQVTEAGESDRLDENSSERPVSLHKQLSREEMTESARDHSDSINTTSPDSESKERALTMSMVSNKDQRYWEYEFKGT